MYKTLSLAVGARALKRLALLPAAVLACLATAHGEEEAGYVSLFNGKDLDGWQVKIVGYPLGENFGDTFRVEDGVLKVSYDQYEQFDDRFGHIFYKHSYSNYRLRIEYRFVGEQVKGGPSWAFRNSGVMIHGQSPESMPKDQNFPVSIEVQFLGGNGVDERHTANLCTPGTHVVMNGKLHTPHCTDSTSKTIHGDQWVTAEVEVRGNTITHLVDGETVLTYTDPQLDPGDPSAQALIDAGAPLMLTGGSISLQSESHPIEFRRVELRELKD
jgi:hypothetical protein